jgi:uncharacterized repeat protein (TIGR01451 family)
MVTATLTDTFPDPDGNGRAAAGEEVTYTARITNSGDADATGVSFTAPVDGNTTLVASSLQPDLKESGFAARSVPAAAPTAMAAVTMPRPILI